MTIYQSGLRLLASAALFGSMSLLTGCGGNPPTTTTTTESTTAPAMPTMPAAGATTTTTRSMSTQTNPQ